MCDAQELIRVRRIGTNKSAVLWKKNEEQTIPAKRLHSYTQESNTPFSCTYMYYEVQHSENEHEKLVLKMQFAISQGVYDSFYLMPPNALCMNGQMHLPMCHNSVGKHTLIRSTWAPIGDLSVCVLLPAAAAHTNHHYSLMGNTCIHFDICDCVPNK